MHSDAVLAYMLRVSDEAVQHQHKSPAGPDRHPTASRVELLPRRTAFSSGIHRANGYLPPQLVHIQYLDGPERRLLETSLASSARPTVSDSPFLPPTAAALLAPS